MNMLVSEWKERRIDSGKLLLFLLCISFAFIFYGKTIAVENINYAVEELHQYNQKLFENNITLLEADYSPRYYANVTVSLLMNILKISWAEVVTIIIRLNFVIYAVAAARTVCKLTNKNRLLYGLLLVSCIFRSSLGTLAGFALNGSMDVFIGTGTALALCAISFLVGEKKSWTLAWIFLALATLMHVHEGMWGGCIVGVIYLSLVIAERRIDWKALRALPIYVAVMLLVVVPSLVNGESVDGALFTHIYVDIRTPHHLLPTEWGADTIVKCLVLLVIPILFLLIKRRQGWTGDVHRKLLIVSLLSVTLWIVILAVQYWATVISPNATIVTMYLPKCFKYVTYVLMLVYLKITDWLYEEKRHLQAFFLLLVLVMGMDYSFTVSLLFAIILLAESVLKVEDRIADKDVPFYYETIKLISWMFLLVFVCVLHGWNEVVLMIAVLVFVPEFILPYLRVKKIVNVIICGVGVFLIGYAVQGTVLRIDENGISYITGTECLISAMGNDVYQLGTEFKAEAEDCVEFLADPNDVTAGWVQLVSEKNCYAICKCTPSSKKAVLEWYDRITRVEGMDSMTDEELSELMREIKLDYVLVQPERAEELSTSALFDVVAETKEAAIYKLSAVEGDDEE